MTVAQAIKSSNATVVLLAEITAGFYVQNWISYGSNSYQVASSLNITSAKQNGAALTLQASAAAVDSNAGSWYYNGTTLYVRPFADQSVFGFDSAVQAFATFYFATRPKIFSAIFYDPRVKGYPSLSVRIEKQFQGVGQIGGGSISLVNADSYFDPLQGLQWNAGTVTLKLGVDLQNNVMAYADYVTVGTFATANWENNGKEFKLTLAEQKSKLRKKIPFDLYDIATYPGIAENDIGNPIPIAYGRVKSISPALISEADKRFKVAGHAIYSFDGVKIKDSDGVWNTSTFATEDLASGEFTLGVDFTGSEEVAVDFTGRKNGDGTPMLNASDIVADILAQCGETNLNTDSFDDAWEQLDLGTNSDGDRVTKLAPVVFIDSVQDAISVVSKINQAVGSFLFSDANGQYFYGVFEPKQGEDLELFTDLDVLSFLERNDIAAIVSKVSADYQPRPQEGFSQVAVVERLALQYVNDENEPVLKKQEVALSEEDDAEYWAERYLAMNGGPLRLFIVEIPWRGFILLPGTQIHFVYEKRNLDLIVEILEVNVDFLSKKTKLMLGDLRGFGDSPGFWMDDADVLPARFASESGYGSGALDWNDSWSDTIKTWARQNVGYWCEDSGAADATDPESFLASVWV